LTENTERAHWNYAPRFQAARSDPGNEDRRIQFAKSSEARKSSMQVTCFQEFPLKFFYIRILQKPGQIYSTQPADSRDFAAIVQKKFGMPEYSPPHFFGHPNQRRKAKSTELEAGVSIELGIVPHISFLQGISQRRALGFHLI
jgi:hypothetical protein